VTILGIITRILALVGKELIEITRRPATLASLILGPFLILALFGLGYQGVRQPVHADLVLPPNSGLPTDPAAYAGAADGLIVDQVVTDQAAAEARLRAREVDAVIVVPPDVQANFNAGKRSTISVEVNMIDPAQVQFAKVMSQQLADRVNQKIIATAVENGQARVGQSNIPPEVVAAPTDAKLVDLAPAAPSLVTFFAPAVLALVLQHLCITLVALSLIRERTSGILELYRVGPTSAWEIVTAKIVSYLVIGGVIAGASFLFILFALQEPFLGPPASVLTVIVMLLVSSIGIGLLVAVLSDSERMAVQASLLFLLASIFFSGFVIDLSLFSKPVQIIAGFIPVTHAIAQLQNVMLFGSAPDPQAIVALFAIAAVSIMFGWLLLRRQMGARS
jgi:ABC-2 type transport system permease protein